MKFTQSVLIFGSFLSLVVYAAADLPRDAYQDWKNRPVSKFSDPETNFNLVKKMLLERYFNNKISNEALYEGATRGMLNALNPSEKEDWNTLYSPDEYQEFQLDTKGELTGIGVEMKFDIDTGLATITNIIPHSAAESAGIQAGDELISVDGKIFKGLQFRDLVYSVRGKVGESVKLKLLRGDSILSKKVTRQKINWSPVELSFLENKIALIKIRHFTESSAPSLKATLEKLRTEHTKGLVIDLRENEGGLFDPAIEAASFFTPTGKTIVKVESRGGTEKDRTSSVEPIFKGIPIAILISGSTSSGAELFAGSLSENIQARLVGEKTHGKWNVQTLEKLSNGYAIKFTTGLFKTPSGKSYAGIGLEPDVKVEKEDALKTATHLISALSEGTKQ